MKRIGIWLLRGVVALVNTASKMQTLQLRLMAGSAKDGVEHFEPYGFTSCPREGAEAVVGFMGGDTSHGVAIVVADRRYRPVGLEPGEVAIFTHEGDSMILRNGHLAELKTGTLRIHASEKVEIDTPVLEATHQVIARGPLSAQDGLAVSGGEDAAAVIDGTLRASVDVIAAGKSAAHHRHAETGSITEEPQ